MANEFHASGIGTFTGGIGQNTGGTGNYRKS